MDMKTCLEIMILYQNADTLNLIVLLRESLLPMRTQEMAIYSGEARFLKVYELQPLIMLLYYR